MEDHHSKGTKRPSNDSGVINERVHIDDIPEVNHSKSRFACKPVDAMRGYYVWMFKKGEPTNWYRRKRLCMCEGCVVMKWHECTLKGLVGGPGDWETVKLHFIDPVGVALEMKRREVNEEQFIRRLKKGIFVPILLDEDFLGSPYGLAKIIRKPYKASRNINNGSICRGDEVLDVTWWTRQSARDLKFQDTGEMQTILMSRMIKSKVSWGRTVAGGRRRRGQQEGGSKTLSTACHERLIQHIQDMNIAPDNDPGDARVGGHEDNEIDNVGYESSDTD